MNARSLLLFLTLAANPLTAATNALVPAAPVPSSPYIAVVYRYADTLLDQGRDTNGTFFAALDRQSIKPHPTTNTHDHQNLLRLLYFLSELSAKPKYRDAADAAVRTFLQNPNFSRPWMLWNRCFEIAPEPSLRFAQSLAERQNAANPGFCLRTWSAAYAHTTNALFLRAIESLLARPEAATVSFAIDCDGSAPKLPEPLAAQLRAFARRQDEAARHTDHPLWRGTSAAQVAMMHVSRYENTGQLNYRDLLQTSADAYLKSSPPGDEDLLPRVLGNAISLQLAAWRSTARPAHLEKAREFADFALARFFEKQPLPRATLKSDHYESGTGADTLTLALAELHMHVLYITAVRYPPNTIDR